MTLDHVATGALTRRAERHHKPGGDERPRPSSRAKLGSPAWLKHAATLLLAAIREIFDESAYARFLNRTHLPSSPQAYAAFRREHEVAKAHNPRCC